jgi:Uma2 family endonuclease
MVMPESPTLTRTMDAEAFEVFLARPENADCRFELINGEIVEKMPTLEHGVIVSNALGHIWNRVRATGVGRVAVEVRYRMPGDNQNSRLPDVVYYMDATLPVVKRGPVPHMPDLIIEVQSPDDTIRICGRRRLITCKTARSWSGWC